MYQILIISPEYFFTRTLINLLRCKGYLVSAVSTIAQAVAKFRRYHFEVVLVSQKLSDGDGIEIVDYLASLSFDTRVILGNCQRDEQRIEALSKGADDCFDKNISPQESLLKIEKLLGRLKLKFHDYMSLGKIKLYPVTGVLVLGKKKLKLRKKEVDILCCLIKRKNQVVTREMLIEAVWYPEGETPSKNTIDVYLRRLRMMMGHYKNHIKTIRGFGYMACESRR